MILLLGETAAAREISKCLDIRGLEFMRLQTWTEKTCLKTPSLILDASPPSSIVKLPRYANGVNSGTFLISG